jgi:hypothetical protein
MGCDSCNDELSSTQLSRNLTQDSALAFLVLTTANDDERSLRFLPCAFLHGRNWAPFKKRPPQSQGRIASLP